METTRYSTLCSFLQTSTLRWLVISNLLTQTSKRNVKGWMPFGGGENKEEGTLIFYCFQVALYRLVLL